MQTNKNNPPSTASSCVATPLAPIGGVVLAEGDVEYNAGRTPITLEVRNTGDRPIQVGSHFHFFESNRYLEFDRPQAFGKHLNIPATTAIRFEPGQSHTVELVPYGGKQRVVGFGGVVNGYTGGETKPTYNPSYARSVAHSAKLGYKSSTLSQSTNRNNNGNH